MPRGSSHGSRYIGEPLDMMRYCPFAFAKRWGIPVAVQRRHRLDKTTLRIRHTYSTYLGDSSPRVSVLSREAHCGLGQRGRRAGRLIDAARSLVGSLDVGMRGTL